MLGMLSKAEQKLLKKWLNSPWCNSNKKLVSFYLLLEKYIPQLLDHEVSKEKICATLFPGKPYAGSRKMLNNLTVQLVRQIEDFMVHQKIANDETQKNIILAEEYLYRSRQDKFLELAKGLLEVLEQKSLKDWDDCLRLALLHEKIYFQQSSTVRHKLPPENLAQLEAYLDLFYGLVRFRIMAEWASRKTLVKSDSDNDPKPELASEFETLKFLKDKLRHPALDLYSMRLEHVGENGLADRNKFKKQFFRFYEKLPEKERDALFACAMNDTVAEFRNGNMAVSAEMLMLMQEGITYGVFLQNGILPTTRFINYVQTATQHGKDKFIKQIIPVLCPLLAPADKAEARCWAEAQIAFSKGNFNLSMDLAQHNFSNHMIRLVAGITLLKTYFEQVIKDRSNYQFFKNYCKKYDRDLRRATYFPQDKLKGYRVLIRYTKQVLEALLDEEGKHPSLERIIEQIAVAQNMEGKQWLMGRLKEFLE